MPVLLLAANAVFLGVIAAFGESEGEGRIIHAAIVLLAVANAAAAINAWGW